MIIKGLFNSMKRRDFNVPGEGGNFNGGKKNYLVSGGGKGDFNVESKF